MKTIILCLIFSFSSICHALSLNDLKAGDVVLLSLNCIECRMIESETNSLFSHSGVVVFDEEHNLRIAQSLGRVALYPFSEFTKNITPKTFVHVYRPRDLRGVSLEQNMLDTFNEKFKGAPFDSKFQWNNFSPEGVEYLYCSEFIAKFLDHFLTIKTQPEPIIYKKHRDYWLKYFRGNIPDGELGNSPSSFSKDARFEFVGTI